MHLILMYLCLKATFSRHGFFLVLFILFVLPFIAYRLLWLASSKPANGAMCFVGHTLETVGISAHPVILFKLGNREIFFNGPGNIYFKPGVIVPVRYQKEHPEEARIDIPVCIWGDTLTACLLPLLVLLVIYFTPEKLDPLIPRRSKVRIGWKPFIKILKI